MGKPKNPYKEAALRLSVELDQMKKNNADLQLEYENHITTLKAAHDEYVAELKSIHVYQVNGLKQDCIDKIEELSEMIVLVNQQMDLFKYAHDADAEHFVKTINKAKKLSVWLYAAQIVVASILITILIFS